MTIKALYPTVQPTLFLDFARTRSLDPRCTFTRAGAAPYIGADRSLKTAAVNIPQFDHDPVTGESLGLKVERESTNLFLSSASPQTLLTVDATVTAANIASPFGTTNDTALVVLNNGTFTGAGEGIYNTFSVAANTTWSFSVFVKKQTSSSAKLHGNVAGAQDFHINYNFDTNQFTKGYHPYWVEKAAPSAQEFPNGWVRISVTLLWDSNVTGTGVFYVSNDNSNGGGTYNKSTVGNGTSGVYVYGPQVEPGLGTTSYIPTTTSSVTRAADVLSITGTNLSSWFDQDGGTFIMKYRSMQVSNGAYSVLWELQNSNTRRVMGYHVGADAISSRYGTFSPGGGGVVNGGAVSNAGALNTVATSFTLSSVSNTANGVTPTTAAHTVATPSNQLLIGRGTDVACSIWLSRLIYYPTNLTTAQLQTFAAS